MVDSLAVDQRTPLTGGPLIFFTKNECVYLFC